MHCIPWIFLNSNSEVLTIKDIEHLYANIASDKADEFKASLIIAVQTLEFNGPNIVIAVKFKADIAAAMDMVKSIIHDFGYDLDVLGSNKIKIKNHQTYIIFDPVFEKYNGSNFLTFSILTNEVVVCL